MFQEGPGGLRFADIANDFATATVCLQGAHLTHWNTMTRIAIGTALALLLLNTPLQAQETSTSSGHYLFAWAGDIAGRGNDFLAVIDADPASATYGKLVTTTATDQKSMQVHHTEYAMPDSEMLFANDHLAGRTFVFDLHDPLHPQVATSFNDMGGFSHPHSFLRLPNGHVLATFQHMHHAEGAMHRGITGGLVEIDDRGQVIRSASTTRL